MNAKSNENADVEAKEEQTENSPNSTGLRSTNSAEELIQTNLDTFVELAESDLPIAEDAEKAIALTDGGTDQ